MKQIREYMINQFAHSLPEYDRPVRFMDIGCEDGALTSGFFAIFSNPEKCLDFLKSGLLIPLRR